MRGTHQTEPQDTRSRLSIMHRWQVAAHWNQAPGPVKKQGTQAAVCCSKCPVLCARTAHDCLHIVQWEDRAFRRCEGVLAQSGFFFGRVLTIYLSIRFPMLACATTPYARPLGFYSDVPRTQRLCITCDCGALGALQAVAQLGDDQTSVIQESFFSSAGVLSMRTYARPGSHAGLEQAASGTGRIRGMAGCWAGINAGGRGPCMHVHSDVPSGLPIRAANGLIVAVTKTAACRQVQGTYEGMLKPAKSSCCRATHLLCMARTWSGTHVLPMQSIPQATRMAVHRTRRPCGAVTPSWIVRKWQGMGLWYARV